MNDRDDELRQTTALFRYGLIADLVHLPLGRAGHRRQAERQGWPDLRHPRHHPNQGRRQHHAGLDQALPRWRLRGPLPQAARRPRPAPADAARGRPSPRRAEGRQPHLVGAQRHPGGHRGRHRPPARRLDRAPAVQPRGPVRQEAPGRRRPPPLRLQGRRRAVDERRHARAKGPARQKPPQDLPHRLHRRRHPHRPLRRLRHRREHPGIPAGVQERHHPARHPPAPLRR